MCDSCGMASVNGHVRASPVLHSSVTPCSSVDSWWRDNQGLSISLWCNSSVALWRSPLSSLGLSRGGTVNRQTAVCQNSIVCPYATQCLSCQTLMLLLWPPKIQVLLFQFQTFKSKLRLLKALHMGCWHCIKPAAFVVRQKCSLLWDWSNWRSPDSYVTLSSWLRCLFAVWHA